MEYTLGVNSVYQLDNIYLNYVVDTSFPNVSTSELGNRNASQKSLGLSQANRENSYKCTSLQSVQLSDKALLELRNYQAEPFIKDPKNTDFDTGKKYKLNGFVILNIVNFIKF